jgi:hypothetical protein
LIKVEREAERRQNEAEKRVMGSLAELREVVKTLGQRAGDLQATFEGRQRVAR